MFFKISAASAPCWVSCVLISLPVQINLKPEWRAVVHCYIWPGTKLQELHHRVKKKKKPYSRHLWDSYCVRVGIGIIWAATSNSIGGPITLNRCDPVSDCFFLYIWLWVYRKCMMTTSECGYCKCSGYLTVSTPADSKHRRIVFFSIDPFRGSQSNCFLWKYSSHLTTCFQTVLCTSSEHQPTPRITPTGCQGADVPSELEQPLLNRLLGNVGLKQVSLVFRTKSQRQHKEGGLLWISCKVMF